MPNEKFKQPPIPSGEGKKFEEPSGVEKKEEPEDYLQELIGFAMELGKEQQWRHYKEWAQDVSEALGRYKQRDQEKYSGMADTIKEFSPDLGEETREILSIPEGIPEEGARKRLQFAQLQELLRIESTNIPAELKEIVGKGIKANNEFVLAYPFESLAKMNLSEEDWEVTKRMVQIGAEKDAEYVIRERKNICEDVYKFLLDDKAFHKLESLKKDYNFQIDSFAIQELTGSPLKDILLEGKIVFSRDIREARLSLFEMLQSEVPGLPTSFRINPNPSFWGRQRASLLSNITDLITFGRPRRVPYNGWEYVAAMRGLDEKDIRRRVSAELITEGRKSGLEKAKERFEYVKEKLTSMPQLRKRFDKVSTMLTEWEKEGQKLEKGPHIIAGAYVRCDAMDLEKPLAHNVSFPPAEYALLHSKLDQSFRSVSQIGVRLKYGIEEMYKFMTERKDDFEKAISLINLLYSGRSCERFGIDTDPADMAVRKKFPEIFDPIELMESIRNTPKGVYFLEPPLHAGARGGEAPEWDVRAYPLRDRAFYKLEKEGKVNFVNVKEYHVQRLQRHGDDLKLRLYSFSDLPDRRSLGESGFSVAIERNGQTRFLNQKEIKDLSKELGTYTLPTLYLKDHPLLKVEEEKK